MRRRGFLQVLAGLVLAPLAPFTVRKAPARDLVLWPARGGIGEPTVYHEAVAPDGAALFDAPRFGFEGSNVLFTPSTHEERMKDFHEALERFMTFTDGPSS